MDRASGPSRLRRVALWVMAAAVFFIFAFQLLSSSKAVSKLNILSPILDDLTGTNTCNVYKPAKRVAIVGQSVALFKLRGFQGTDKMRKELGLEVLRQLIISISSKILVAR